MEEVLARFGPMAIQSGSHREEEGKEKGRERGRERRKEEEQDDDDEEEEEALDDMAVLGRSKVFLKATLAHLLHRSAELCRFHQGRRIGRVVIRSWESSAHVRAQAKEQAQTRALTARAALGG